MHQYAFAHLFFVQWELFGVNPFKPNEISHYYQVDQPISALMVVMWYLFFLFLFKF